METDLYHHGILGQRWGKKNGPPYPIGASNHSASEKKAGWTKSLNKKTTVMRYNKSRNEYETVESDLRRKKHEIKTIEDYVSFGEESIDKLIKAYDEFDVLVKTRDAKYEEVLEQYKKLGRNKLTTYLALNIFG